MALFKLSFGLFFLALLFAAWSFLYAYDVPDPTPMEERPPFVAVINWYRSNVSGMPIEQLPSQAAAFRYEYSLSIENVNPQMLPAMLPRSIAPFYDDQYYVELRRLFENGLEISRQWIFRDSEGLTRLHASGSGARFGARVIAGENGSGFIELGNNYGAVIREFRFEEDLSEWDFRYTFSEGFLTRAETWFKNAPPNAADSDPPPGPPVFVLMYTDLYRYTRSGSLRAIDRTFHAGAAVIPRLRFPQLGPRVFQVDELVTPTDIYASGFLMADLHLEGTTISYSLDIRGRIQRELWRDEEGRVIGEITNTWEGDRLVSVLWEAPGDRRLIEFDFNAAGDRIAERNIRNGILERSVTIHGDSEIEEIFMGGRLVLRAYWESGVRIREERISAPPLRLR